MIRKYQGPKQQTHGFENKRHEKSYILHLLLQKSAKESKNMSQNNWRLGLELTPLGTKSLNFDMKSDSSTFSISTTKEDTDIWLLPSEREQKTRISTILRVRPYKIVGWNRNRQNAFFNSDIAIVR